MRNPFAKKKPDETPADGRNADLTKLMDGEQPVATEATQATMPPQFEAVNKGKENKPKKPRHRLNPRITAWIVALVSGAAAVGIFLMLPVGETTIAAMGCAALSVMTATLASAHQF